MKKNTILLIAGVVVTLLFIILAIPLFEAMYYEREFSTAMYDENIYMLVSVVTAIVAWAVAGVFYYVINSVSFSRWYHWLIMLAVAALVTPTINYFYADGVFVAMDYDFGHQLFSFAVVNMLVEVVLFVVASFSMRWWSSNCRHTPIPE